MLNAETGVACQLDVLMAGANFFIQCEVKYVALANVFCTKALWISIYLLLSGVKREM